MARKTLIRLELLGNGRWLVDAIGQQLRTFATQAEALAEARDMQRCLPGSQIVRLADRA